MLLTIMGLLKYKKFAAVNLLGLVFLLTSCDLLKDSTIKTQTGYSLGTSYSIKYEVAHDSIDLRDEIETIFVDMNESLSTYLPTSLISRVNNGDSTLVVDTYFKDVFYKAYEIWEKTNGDFDPTIGTLVNAWGFGPGNQIDGLTKNKVDSLLSYVGMDKLKITDKGTVKKDDPNIFIDFNALAKGYTIDEIGRFFDRNNIDNYLIEIGGEILTKGQNTDRGQDWIVAIDDPRQEEERRTLIAKVKLSNMAMATSGNYRKYRIDETSGELYVHTINTKTGYPQKSNILSVTVVAPNCTEADAYATAFMVMDTAKVKKLSESLPDIETYMLISGENGEIEKYITPGFKALLVND
ncbi:FAD:protein FMN transferase [Flavobacteriaceae bacterium M23B6Z8]